MVKMGGASLHDFREVFRANVEKRIRCLPEIDGLSKVCVQNIFLINEHRIINTYLSSMTFFNNFSCVSVVHISLFLRGFIHFVSVADRLRVLGILFYVVINIKQGHIITLLSFLLTKTFPSCLCSFLVIHFCVRTLKVSFFLKFSFIFALFRALSSL